MHPTHLDHTFDPWVSQGDIFTSVPMRDGEPDGPAMLVTADCQLDKGKNGRPSVGFLNFLPLRDVAAQSAAVIVAVRGGSPPRRVLYLGEVFDEGWDAVVFLGDIVTIDVERFDPEIDNDACPGDPHDSRRLVLHANADRMGRIAQDRQPILKTNLSSFWTGEVPPPEE